jgi:hypothetical protein
VGDVSTRLRRARERAGLEIADISARTKIKPAFITAIETGHFETLPGHFFTRMFLKAYAREVRLSPDEVVRQFDLVHSTPEAVALPELAAVLEENPRPTPRPVLPPRQPHRGWQMVAVTVGGLVVLALLTAPGTTRDPGVPAVADVPAPAEPPRPIGTTGGVPESLTIDIRPTEVIWVAAKADGHSALYKLLQPGQTVTLAGKDFSFRIGNAAAFVYAINGAPGKSVGGVDEVREFQITTANYRGYLR